MQFFMSVVWLASWKVCYQELEVHVQDPVRMTVDLKCGLAILLFPLFWSSN